MVMILIAPTISATAISIDSSMLMAIVFLSEGLVFGEAEVSEALYECSPTFKGFTGGIYADGSGTNVCTTETHSADWWCTGEGNYNDCDNDGDIDYAFCSGTSIL